EKNLVLDSDNEEGPMRTAYRDSFMSVEVPMDEGFAPSASAPIMETIHDEEEGDHGGGGSRGDGEGVKETASRRESTIRAAKTQVEYDVYVTQKSGSPGTQGTPAVEGDTAVKDPPAPSVELEQ
ncbi:hypothetical protein HK101_011660, partial [Irineochytrium annulatum]